jgi:hypothetical protein
MSDNAIFRTGSSSSVFLNIFIDPNDGYIRRREASDFSFCGGSLFVSYHSLCLILARKAL